MVGAERETAGADVYDHVGACTQSRGRHGPRDSCQGSVGDGSGGSVGIRAADGSRAIAILAECPRRFRGSLGEDLAGGIDGSLVELLELRERRGFPARLPAAGAVSSCHPGRGGLQPAACFAVETPQVPSHEGVPSAGGHDNGARVEDTVTMVFLS